MSVHSNYAADRAARAQRWWSGPPLMPRRALEKLTTSGNSRPDIKYGIVLVLAFASETVKYCSLLHARLVSRFNETRMHT